MGLHIKKRVFITGINGFTGRYLEDYFINKGYNVYGTVLTKPKKGKHFCCNLLDKETLINVVKKIKPNYVLHLAGISFVASENQLNIYNVNVFGTLNLLDAIEKTNYSPEKILIASSAAVYGNREGELNEDMCPYPNNHYGNSKLIMENMVRQYFDKLSIIITRPFNYTGKGQRKHFLIPKIVSHYLDKKEEIELGNIDVYREFNDVEFIVESYYKLLLSIEKSLVVNICSGKVTNITNILSIMEHISGHKLKVKINKKFVRLNEILILKGSTEKMKSLLGAIDENYQIERTLSKMYRVN